jgi:hypothetical protein
MAHSPPTGALPNIAKTQFYFIDACRNLPVTVQNLQDPQTGYVFDVEDTGLDYRSAPVFFASPPDAKAQAVPREQTLFVAALLRCLSGEAAVAPRDDGNGRESSHWHVTSHSLNCGLKAVVNELNRKFNGVQKWTADGFGEETPLCFLPTPPVVPVSIMVEPDPAVPKTRVRILDPSNAVLYTFPSNGSPHPYEHRLPAGHYNLEAQPAAPYIYKQRPCTIEPLGSRLWKLKVSP